MNHCKSVNSSELFGAGQVVVVQWAFRASFDENSCLHRQKQLHESGKSEQKLWVIKPKQSAKGH